jgi:hypothetical protein
MLRRKIGLPSHDAQPFPNPVRGGLPTIQPELMDARLDWMAGHRLPADQIKKVGLDFELPESLFGLRELQIQDATAAA